MNYVVIEIFSLYAVNMARNLEKNGLVFPLLCHVFPFPTDDARYEKCLGLCQANHYILSSSSSSFLPDCHPLKIFQKIWQVCMKPWLLQQTV